MSVQAEPYRPRGALRPWPRRVLAAIGRATIASTSRLLLFIAFGTTVAIAAFRREVWRVPVWVEFKRVLHEVAVRSLPTAVVTGVLMAFALVTQAIYWLAQTGTQGLVGPVIVIVLIRELVPILVGLIVFGRSGTATLIELGEAHPRGWMRLFEIQGLDPLALLVLPRAVAFAVGSFCIGTILLASTLLGSYMLAYGLELIAYSFWDFADVVQRSMKIQDFIVPPIKCIIIGYLVALTCCSTGLGRRDDTDELQRLVPRGFVRSALALLLVNTMFDLVV